MINLIAEPGLVVSWDEFTHTKPPYSIALDGQALITFRDNQDGTYTYSIGKISSFINFPIPEFYHVLNQAENLNDTNDQWGGSTIIGGSPRRSGSKLTPKELENIVNDYLSSTQ